MEKELEYQKFNNASQKNIIPRLSLSICAAILTGVLTYIITGVFGKKKEESILNSKVDYTGLSESNPEKIDAGSKVFKVRDALRNKLYLRARRRFITG